MYGHLIHLLFILTFPQILATTSVSLGVFAFPLFLSERFLFALRLIKHIQPIKSVLIHQACLENLQAESNRHPWAKFGDTVSNRAIRINSQSSRSSKETSVLDFTST